MKLSVVVITLNEEPGIERCLSSLTFADEIVVLDSFSTDRTVEIAKRFTDKISYRKFEGYSDQRNAAMDIITNDWVLFVDADEVVPPELAAEVRKAIESDQFAGYRMPRLTYFLGEPIFHCGWYPDHIIRLARKSRSHYGDRLVHETLEVDGPVGMLKHDLIHYTYNSLDDLVRKMTAYSRAAARQKFMDGERFGLSKLLFAPGLTFLKKYIVKQGYRDGFRGFLICSLSQFGVFLRYAMLWEMSIRKERES